MCRGALTTAVTAVWQRLGGVEPAIGAAGQATDTETGRPSSRADASGCLVRHVLALFSLQAYNIATTLHSIAMITTNSVMTTLILVAKKGGK